MEIYCPRCNTEKPAEQFYRNNNRRRGRSVYCIPCSQTYLQGRRDKKRQEKLVACHVCGFVPFTKRQTPAQASGLHMCRNCATMARTARWEAYVAWLAGRTSPYTDPITTTTTTDPYTTTTTIDPITTTTTDPYTTTTTDPITTTTPEEEF